MSTLVALGREELNRTLILNNDSNVFVNAPYFDSLTLRILGADGLPWRSPSLVLATNCGVCSVEVCACVYCFV